MKVLLALAICLVSSQAQDGTQHGPAVAQPVAQPAAAHEMAEGAQRGPRLVQQAPGPAQHSQQGRGVAQGAPEVAQAGQRLAQQPDPRLAQQAPWHPVLLQGFYPAPNASAASPWRPMPGAQQVYQQLVQEAATERPSSAIDSAYYIRPVLQAYQPYTSAAYQQSPQPMQVVNLVEYEPEDAEAQFLPFQEHILRAERLVQPAPEVQREILRAERLVQQAPEVQGQILRAERLVQQAPEVQGQRFVQRRAPSELLTTLVYLGPQTFERTP